MNLDDDSLLSAFFDEELDPGERTRVAEGIDSSPDLVGLLADFGSLRATLRTLDRPAAPVDLAGVITERLATLGLMASAGVSATPSAPTDPALAPEGASELVVIALPDPPTRRQRWAGRARVAASFVGVGSVAASLLFASILLFHALHETADPRRPGATSGLDSTADLRNHPSESSLDSAPSLVELPAPAPTPALVSNAPTIVALAPADGPAAPARRADEADRADLAAPGQPVTRLLAKAKEPTAGDEAPGNPGTTRPKAIDMMLGRSQVVRVAIAAATPERAADQVRAIIEQTPDREVEFGRISLPPGVVLDPARPGTAEVFAVVLRDGAERDLVDRLREAFRGQAVEVEASPDLVTQLTEVGDAVVLARTPPARLGPTPLGLNRLAAVKDAGVPDQFPTEGRLAQARDGQPDSTPAAEPQARFRSEIAAPVARSAAPGSPPLGRPQGQAAAAAKLSQTELAAPESKPAANAPAPASPAPTTTGPVTVLIWVTRSAP